ncbi:ribonucleotide reductase 2A [Prunus dulcis]|uniref:Ribonucleotide reductase 2A n=1 Tax=Prunus dulcis TaxID=3755 RepID=A0A4Y1QN58_PRUDU|nr:ribonucleotide reductase 2A [Prunus dulcis]
MEGATNGREEHEEETEQEPILMEQSERFCMFPIRYKQVWEMYKKAMASFWTAEEVDLSQDVQQWDALSDSEKHFVSHVLAFFAASDGIVLENLAARFLNDVQIPEARAFYGFQLAMENIHSEMYSLLLETYIKDSMEKHRLFNAIESIPCVSRKAKWALDWIHSSNSFAERLVAFACVEGIFFSGRLDTTFLLFSSPFSPLFIVHLRFSASVPYSGLKRGLNARDEGLHCDFACLLYSLLRKQLPWQKVHGIVHEAVEIEIEFVCEALPCALIGMNSDLMSQYIKFVADRLLVALGYQRKYNVENPLIGWSLFLCKERRTFLREGWVTIKKHLLCQASKMVERISSSRWTQTSSHQFVATFSSIVLKCRICNQNLSLFFVPAICILYFKGYI